MVYNRRKVSSSHIILGNEHQNQVETTGQRLVLLAFSSGIAIIVFVLLIVLFLLIQNNHQEALRELIEESKNGISGSDGDGTKLGKEESESAEDSSNDDASYIDSSEEENQEQMSSNRSEEIVALSGQIPYDKNPESNGGTALIEVRRNASSIDMELRRKSDDNETLRETADEEKLEESDEDWEMLESKEEDDDVHSHLPLNFFSSTIPATAKSSTADGEDDNWILEQEKSNNFGTMTTTETDEHLLGIKTTKDEEVKLTNDSEENQQNNFPTFETPQKVKIQSDYDDEEPKNEEELLDTDDDNNRKQPQQYPQQPFTIEVATAITFTSSSKQKEGDSSNAKQNIQNIDNDDNDIDEDDPDTNLPKISESEKTTPSEPYSDISEGINTNHSTIKTITNNDPLSEPEATTITYSDETKIYRNAQLERWHHHRQHHHRRIKVLSNSKSNGDNKGVENSPRSMPVLVKSNANKNRIDADTENEFRRSTRIRYFPPQPTPSSSSGRNRPPGSLSSLASITVFPHKTTSTRATQTPSEFSTSSWPSVTDEEEKEEEEAFSESLVPLPSFSQAKDDDAFPVSADSQPSTSSLKTMAIESANILPALKTTKQPIRVTKQELLLLHHQKQKISSFNGNNVPLPKNDVEEETGKGFPEDSETYRESQKQDPVEVIHQQRKPSRQIEKTNNDQYHEDQLKSIPSVMERRPIVVHSSNSNNQRGVGGLASFLPFLSSSSSTSTAKTPPHGQQTVSNLPEPLPETTVVTALFDIGRERWPRYARTMDKYHRYMGLLLKLRVPMVIFVDLRSFEFVQRERKRIGWLDKTKVFRTSISHLPFWQFRTEISTIMNRELNTTDGWLPEWEWEMRLHPEACSPEYDILVNSKPFFLYWASSENPFGTEQFVWLDAGYGHGKAQHFPEGFHWSPVFPKGRISLIKLTPESDSIDRYSLVSLYRQDISVVSGGFLAAGDRNTIERFYRLYVEMFIDLVRKENRVDDDQTLLVLLINNNLEMFEIHHSHWFGAFQLY